MPCRPGPPGGAPRGAAPSAESTGRFTPTPYRDQKVYPGCRIHSDLMSVTPDSDCCATKCLTLQRCDGPWCLARPCSCSTQCTQLGQSTANPAATLTLTSSACCGPVRCGDTLTLSGNTYTISFIGNGVIVADNGANDSIRLEGYNGHLVGIKFYGSHADARDGLSGYSQRYQVHRRCATNGDCSTQIPAVGACSTDPSGCSGLPCPC